MGLLGSIFGGGGKSSSSTTSTSQQSYTDSRSVSSWDSHDDNSISNTSYSTSSTANNSGNTTVNWTGTDDGAVRLAELQAHTMDGLAAGNVDAFKALAKFSDNAIGSVTELVSQSAANSLAASTHMLDLTGELVDKLATGTGNAVAENAAVAQSMTASATKAAASGAQMQKYLMIGGAVLLAVLVLKR